MAICGHNAALMAKKRSRKKTTTTTADYRHKGSKRKNNPPARIASEGRIPQVEKAKYHYSPHLTPKLRFDPEGDPDKLPKLLAEARQRPLSASEAAELNEALRQQQPWLEWTEKREQHERRFFEVDPVALHIHERVSAQAILKVAARQDVERSLFADPEQEYHEAVQFYKHDIDWTNRLILGDSLQVMSSLARRENLAGKVQMIYIDPPYGIKFASNFQPELGNRDVKENDASLTREPEMVRAYSDTWHLGVHSYLTYLRDRLIVARDLLADSGSIFVQISDENLHRIRMLLDEVFGPENFQSVITFRSSVPLKSTGLPSIGDYVIWYARSAAQMKRYDLYLDRRESAGSMATYVEEPTGHRRTMSEAERTGARPLDDDCRVFATDNLVSSGFTPTCIFDVEYEGTVYSPTSRKSWKTNRDGMTRLLKAHRVNASGKTIRAMSYVEDYPVQKLSNFWTDTTGAPDKRYVVETPTKVIPRCLLMTTDPGDLVLDPTCGSGTTAYVAEHWGRRWITIDTSRVSVAIARQRLMIANFEHFEVSSAEPSAKAGVDPGSGFAYRQVPHVTLGCIAQDSNLDPIFDKHEIDLSEALSRCNDGLGLVTNALRDKAVGKLADKIGNEGWRAPTDADRRRWLIPGTTKAMIENALASAFAGTSKRATAKQIRALVDKVPTRAEVGPSSVPEKGIGWEHWQVPFDADPDWPQSLQDAITAYRKAWRAKMDEVNACISANADQEALVDKPEVVKGVVRVSGPFTVEGVMPAELSLNAEGLFGGEPEDLEAGEVGTMAPALEMQNIHGYLTEMVSLIADDGVNFLNNEHQAFARVEPLFDAGAWSGIHAEGAWENGASDNGASDRASVAIGFGPQYGPVTAAQVEDLIRESSRGGYDELVVAGFSFDPEATAILQNPGHPKLRIHAAQIRPDINPGMKGLLKKTPANSQLFTVFGLPSIEVKPVEDGEYQVTLEGVDIYDPVKNEIRSTGATKVAAWFIDGDYDGRTFCTTQAFFPDQDAWDKLAKALGSVVEPEAFAAFKGTVSLPFPAGKHKRIAVKVIDPRGNEVMTTHALD